MKIYRTNMALGYNQYAHLIRLNKTKEGHDYMCLENVGDFYQEGESVANYADFEIELTDKSFNDFRFCKTFAFQAFIKSFPFDEPEKDYQYLDKANADFCKKIEIKAEALLPPDYEVIPEPKYFGNGCHSIRELEKMIWLYKEVVHRQKLREQQLLKIFNAEIV